MEGKQKVLRIYTEPNGGIPFDGWFNSLKDPVIKMRIRARLDRLVLGNYGDHKSVGDGVQELRLAFGPGYRVYFAEQDDFVIILLCGGDKNSQERDIKKVKRFWKELQERCGE